MEIFLAFLFLALGFVLLLKGADFLVKGSVSLAKKFNVSQLVIGLTIVAFGTSMPELIVNIISSTGGFSDMVFGNVVGSNTANILLILGISGMIAPLAIQKSTVWKEIPFAGMAVLLLFFLVNDNLFFGNPENVLSRMDGIIFLALFVFFMFYAVKIVKIEIITEEQNEVEIYPSWKMALFIGGGLAGLFLGGNWVVDNAVILAKKIGISEKLISLTIVSIGTSLPELATSAVAAYRKQSDIAVGNIVGSNIFNVFLILGVSAVVRPAPYDPVMNIDLYVCFTATLFLFLSTFSGKRNRIDRWEAFVFFLSYAGYVSYLIIRK
ncbi:MAG TPA: sodium:proton exchanger [Spirochaetia bacterium]